MSNRMTEALSTVGSRAPRIVREHEVLRVAGWIPGENPEQMARAAAGEVLRWAEVRAGQRLPPRAWAGETFDLPLPGRDPSAIRLRAGESDLWALRIHDPDKTVPGRAWTTEIVIGHVPNKPPQFSSRLLVATPERELSIDPAVPSFVRQIARKCGLAVGSQVSSPVESHFRVSEEADALVDHLLNPERLLPTVVLTVPEGGSAPLVNARKLAGALTGLAHLAVVQPAAAWRLTERLGKRLSVFGGAIRVYRPAFDYAADPFAHRLVLSGEVGSHGGVDRTSRWIQEIVAQYSLKRTRLGDDVLPFSSIRAAQLEFQQSSLLTSNASDSDQLAAAFETIRALKREVEELKVEQSYYIDEFSKERERAEFAESQAQRSSYRIQQLTERIKLKGEDPDRDVVTPEDWIDFATWCEEYLAGRLVLAPNARRGVRKPLFNDVQTAANCLLWLANEGRDRFINGGGTLSNIPVFEGVENAPCGGDVFEFEWSGRRLSAEWHIKAGGNTRDPARCLRIYYCFDDQTQQIIVADMPAHRRTGAT